MNKKDLGFRIEAHEYLRQLFMVKRLNSIFTVREAKSFIRQIERGVYPNLKVTLSEEIKQWANAN